MKHLFLLISVVVTITASAQLVEICNNGIDDDFDGFIDCYDGTCANSPSCAGIFLGNDANCTSIPAQFPKFTMSLDFSSPNETTNHLARMVIGDLDRDGIPEIATMNRYTNMLYVLNGNNGSIKYSKVVTFEPYWEVATANVDNDNCAEIFYIGYLPEISHTVKVGKKTVTIIDQIEGIYLFAYDCQLNFLWRTVEPFPSGNDPINYGVADFDGDGIVEIYAKDEVYDAKTGTRLIKSTAANYQTINGGPVAVNMLGDSKLELVIGLNIYQVTIPAGRIADSGSLTLLQGRNDYFIRYEYNATSVADYNLDGFLDVLASGSTIADGKNTTVFYWDVKNNAVKTYSDPQPGMGAAYTNGWQNGTGRLNVADLDGDGKMNVSYVSGGLLYALNENWGLFWKVNINEQTSGYTGCTLFDFNGDGKAEIVYRDERFLYIINGTDGSNYQNPQPCISRTNREYPIVADVDADGATEICVTCGFDDVAAAANFNNIAYSRYSHIRVFKSAGTPWVPARRVWNQHGYFVVNVNDDLTIPKIVQAHQLVWSTGSCTQGPNRPLNKFLNQSPFLNSKGCPTYAAVDFSFSSIKPTITPPTCPNVNFTVSLQITNLGDATINGNVPISFYTSNPKRAGATKLNTINIALNNFAKNSTVNLTNQVINGVGSDSLYVVLNDAGTSVPTSPITLPNAPIVECSYTDNIFGAGIHPIPVKLTALEVNKNDPCANPPNGAARAYVPIAGGGENTTDYNFYWFKGTVAKPIPSADYVGPIYSGIPDGTYMVYSRHKTAGCNSDTVQVIVGANPGVPAITVTVVSNQTVCNPPNGQLQALVAGGNAGFTFNWYDVSLNPLGISGPTASSLLAGNYIVIASRNGCSNKSPQATVSGPQVPDATAKVLLNVTDCSNPNSGSVQADALIGGVIQNPANYTFDWYFYNNATSTRGTILPAANGAGQIRTGLAVGYYQAVIKDNATQCIAGQSPIVQVISQTVLPTASIAEIFPQTSCDPVKPNGVLKGTGVAPGLTSPTDFTFEWFKGDNTLPANKVLTVSGAKGETLNQVSGGGIYYTVKVTTALNCTATAKYIISENVNVPVLTLTQLTPNSVCDAAKATNPYNGSIQATVTFGGVAVTLPDPLYQFTWYNGPTVSDPVIAVADPKNPALSGLKDANYTAIVQRTDLFCTSVPKTQTVVKATVLPVLSSSSTGSNNCNAALTPDGTVTVSVTNPVAGDEFGYQWYSGNAVIPANALGAANNGTSVTAIKVGGPTGAPKPYTVLVSNKTTGCENNTTQFVADNSVIPVLSFASIVPNSICSPATSFNGSLTAQVNNIPAGFTIADYTFKWYDGNSNAAPVDGTSTSTLLNKLDAGFYTVDGKNAKTGCQSAPITNQVPNAKIFPILVPSATGSHNCSGPNADGTAIVTISNIQAGDAFTYQWYKGNVVGPGALGAGNNGTSATAIKVGGPVGAPNPYTVLVTNTTSGCTSFTTASVPDNNTVPILSLTPADNSICNGALGYNGSISTTFTDTNGAADPHTYKWSNGNNMASPIAGQTAATLPGQNGGFYTATISNTTLGCTSSPVTAEIKNNQVLPAISAAPIPSTNCAAADNGTVTALITNGAAGQTFAFAWHKGTLLTDPAVPNGKGGNTPTIIGQQGGKSYIVLATNNQTGCTNTFVQILADNSAVPVLTLTPADNSICTVGAYNGSISTTFTDTNGAPDPHTYIWSAGNNMASPIAGQTAATLPGQNGGFYTATITNTTLGCTSSPVTAQILNNQVFPAISAAPTPSTNCAGGADNGKVVGTVTNPGANTFSFGWHKGNLITDPAVASVDASPNSTISAQQGGKNYTVLITNNQTGCKNTFTQILADNSAVPTFTLPTTPNTKCVANPNYDGTATVTGLTDTNAIGGDTYTIVFHGGNTVGAPVVQTGASLLLNLQNKGFITTTVTNNRLNCTSNAVTSEILETLTNPTVTTSVFNSTNCAGGNLNGSANVTSVVPAGPYEYRWYTGTTVGAPGAFINGTLATTNITGKQGGGATADYIVEVTLTATGCKGTKTVTIQDDSQLPQITPLNFTNNTNCTAPKNGTAFVNAATPFKYRGSTITAAYAGFTLAWSGGTVLPSLDKTTALAAGSYTLQVTAGAGNTVTNNNDNCISNFASVAIVDNLTYPVITVAETDQTSCNAALPNGKLTATGDGVANPLTHNFTWYDGVGTGGPIHVQASTGVINALASSDYTVQIQIIATGCTSTQSGFVPNNIVNPSLTFVGVSPVTKCNAPDGSATVSLVNISAPAKYDLFYVFTSTISGAAYPTDPVVIKASPDPKNITNGFALPSPIAYGGMIPGYLTALVVDKNTSCESSPVTQQILDNTVQSSITVNLIASAGVCGGGFGGIDPTVIPPSIYNFEWYVGAPTNATPINFFNNLPTFDPLLNSTANPNNQIYGDNGPNLGINHVPSDISISPGTFTLVVRDAGTGCGAYHTDNVPTTSQPVISMIPTDRTRCDITDGKLDVSVTSGTSLYSINIYVGNSKSGASIGSIGYSPINTVVSVAGIAEGPYFAEIVDITAIACPLGNNQTIKKIVLPPIISQGAIGVNTSCDPNASADGSVAITVTDDTNDKYTAVTGFQKNYQISSIAPNSPAGLTYTALIGTGASGQSETITGMSPVQYTITVIDTKSNCTNNTVVTIPDQQGIPSALTITPTPETMCGPASAGSALASVAPATEYDFEWYSDNALVNIVNDGVANPKPGNGVGTGGELLNQGKIVGPAVWPMGAAGLGSGDRTFFARGKKNGTAASGVGCYTQVVQVTIQDTHSVPVATITTSPNTSCDPAIGEGSLVVTTVTSSGIAAIQNSLYDYSIAPDLNTANPVSINKNGTIPYSFLSLTDNGGAAYVLTALNQVNGCKVDNNVTIQPTKFQMSITNFTTQDKLMCNPDGSINVTQIDIDRTATGQSTLTYTGAVPTMANNFDFRWFSGAPGAFASPAALKDAALAFIPGQVLTDGGGAGQYPTMGAGTFYVVAKRKTTGDVPIVGAGCETPAVQVNITDKHVNPIATLTPFSNTSCNAAFEGEIDVTVSDASVTVPATPPPYTFNYVWASSGTTTPANATFNVGASPPFTGLENANYTLTATNNQTGCVVSANTTITKNATPIFITASTVVPKYYCDPSGNINITQVQFQDRAGATQTPAIGNFTFGWTQPSGVAVPAVTTANLDSVTFGGIAAGVFQVVATRSVGAPGAGCSSAPVNIEIKDKTVSPVVALTAFNNTSCVAAFEGEIQVQVTDASRAKVPPVAFSYNYDWTSSPNPIASSPSVGNNGDKINNGAGPDHDDETGLQEGAYTLQVINAVTGCKILAVTSIIKNSTPVFITASAVVPKYYCDPSGNIVITQVQFQDRAGVTQTPVIGNFTFAWTQPGGAPVPAVTTANLDSVNFAGIAAGVYQVVATRSVGAPGAGCSSAPANIEIKDKTLSPFVTLTPFSNTSCTVAFEGEIQVDVTDASRAKVPPVAFNYDYAWSDPNAAGLTLPAPNPDFGRNGLANSYLNLQDGAYAVRVTNAITKCFMDATTTILKNASPVITQLVTPTDQVRCSADGKLVVNEVKVIDRSGNVKSSAVPDFPITDFDFTYSRTTVANTLPGITATQLDNTNYPTIGADTYFVVATRRIGTPGAGCSSVPYKVDIVNKQIFPVASLTPLANTSCDPNAFEGEITVTVADGSVNLPAPLAGAPFLFNYLWTASASPVTLPVGSTTVNNDSDGFGGGENDGVGIDNDGDHPKLLKDGVYTVSVTNTQTSCTSTGTTTIFQNSTPVFTQLVTPTPQIVCNPDGTLVVNEVKVIDRNGTVQSNLNGDFPMSDFEFTYDRTTIGNTVFGPTAATQLDNSNYNTIGFDSYYVVATRVAGGPGRTCKSAPYKVDILDRRLFPKVAFTSLANSSCNAVKPNGSVTANASEQNGTNADPYTFSWIANSAALSPPATQTDTNNSSVVANALDGTYVVTATNTTTGCPVDASFNLQLDQVRSTPNIIDVTTLDPIDCNPTANAEVTKITLGSQTNSLLFPPNIPPNNTVTGPALANFNYAWYHGSIAPADLLPVTTPCIGPACPTPTAGLVPGNYFVFVLDPTTDCQSGPKEVVIKNDQIILPVVTLNQTIKQISCTATTGTAALAASVVEADGTTGSYNFTWYPSLDLTGTAIAAPSATNNPNTISNLVVGNYSVNVQNLTTSCMATTYYIVPDDAPSFRPIISLGGQPSTLCVGQDGTVSARVVDVNVAYPFPLNFTADLYFGGTPNLNGPPDIPSMGMVPGFNTSFIEVGLPNGVYTVRITDNNTSCTAVDKVSVKDERQYPVPALELIAPVTNCDPVRPNGVASVTADGTFVGFEFNWYEGGTVAGLPVYTGSEYGGLKPMLYTIEAKNLITGCTATIQTTVPDASLPIPIPNIEKLSDVTSCLVDNGSLASSVGADKNTRDYVFDWYDGSKENPPSDFVGDTYADLKVGTYSVTATSNITGCKSPLKREVINKVQVFPDFTFFIQNPTCDQSNGFAQLILSSNVPVDRIEWENGNGPFQEGVNLSGVAAGIYKVTVTSTLGCATTKDIEIKPDVRPYNGISRNNDGQNEFFKIDCIQDFPNNIVKIYNRAGTLVYEARDYDNSTTYFDGKSNRGVSLMGNQLPDGTYFYIVDKRDGSKPVAGYLEIVN